MLGPLKGLWILGAAALAGIVFVTADYLHGGGIMAKRRRPTHELAGMLAAQLHEDWRKPRYRSATRDYEPRVKPTRDEAWIAAHNKTEVDIANTGYLDLPQDWQAENKASAVSRVGGSPGRMTR